MLVLIYPHGLHHNSKYIGASIGRHLGTDDRGLVMAACPRPRFTSCPDCGTLDVLLAHRIYILLNFSLDQFV